MKSFILLLLLIFSPKIICLIDANSYSKEEYSFKAIYHSSSINEIVSLFGTLPVEISKMLIDNKEVEPCNSYTFQSIGSHIIYVLIDISESTSLYKMFYNIKNLDSIYFYKNFDTKNIQNFNWMFYGCISLSEIDISLFNTESLVYMNRMFFYCQSLVNIDLSNFNTTNLKGMEGLFIRGYSLQKINFGNFNTKNVINMGNLFFRCSKIENLDLSKFDTSSVTNMENMFQGCNNLINLDISKFNTENVKNMD